MTKIDDGGPAYPCRYTVMATEQDRRDHGVSCYEKSGAGMSLRQWYAGHAPEPDRTRIVREMERDKALNPYNEPSKPPLRSEIEIIADLAFEYADAMIAASRKEKHA